jgi:hypothetical protein
MTSLADLVATYDQRTETGRGKLLDEMEALDGRAEARRRADSDDASQRRLAARLMHLLPDPGYVDALEHLCADPDADVAAAARRALRGQRRSPEWEASVERLAASPDPALRDAATGWKADSRRGP